MDGYQTPLGETGTGRDLNENLEHAVKFSTDILNRAAAEKLDVYMLCGSLHEELRRETFKKVGCPPFEASLRKVLEGGNNVSIFVWGDPHNTTFSPSLLKDFAEARDGHGMLDVRVGQVDEQAHRGKIAHFLMAAGHSPIVKEPRYFLRIELPHQPFTEEELRSPATTNAHAALFFNTPEGLEQAESASRVFEKLFGAAKGNLDPIRRDLEALKRHAQAFGQIEPPIEHTKRSPAAAYARDGEATSRRVGRAPTAPFRR